MTSVDHKSETNVKDSYGDAHSIASTQGTGEVALGVRTIVAANSVYGKYSKWALFISLGLAAYIYSLDGTTTWAYLAIATSSFGHHSFIASITVSQGIIIAVGKPITAKFADVTSRGKAYVGVVFFYVIGYIVIASSKNVNSLAGGIVLYAMGYTGSQVLTQIIIADHTTLKYRGLVSGLISLPYIINGFVGANVSTQVLQGVGWRWGYGMFAILVPVSIGPLIITLNWAEHKAKRLGLLNAGSTPAQAVNSRFKVQSFGDILGQLDFFGLLLLSAIVALILLPLTLAATAKGGWNNPSMIAMLVVGVVLIPAFVFWEWKFALHPVIPVRFLRNRSVMGAALIGFFDFISFYLTYTYLYSFVLVVKPWSLINSTYFSMTQTVALTIFGILGGVVMRYVHGFKWLLITGLCIRLLGVGLMIHSRGANASDAEIVMTQIIQGMGGGFAAVTIQVAAQASVPHTDVAQVTAFVLLITEIGNSIGSSIAGAIWTNLMPGKLAHYLPDVSAQERATLFGSITTIISTEPRGTPIREGVILAYGDVMKIMVIVATVFAIFPVLLALWMPDFYLGDQQNAVDNKDLAGNLVTGAGAGHKDDSDRRIMEDGKATTLGKQ